MSEKFDLNKAVDKLQSSADLTDSTLKTELESYLKFN